MTADTPKCPHCGNDDPSLLERLGHGQDRAGTTWLCSVCAKMWVEWQEPFRSIAAATVRRVLVIWLCAVVLLEAQTVDPRAVEFAPSPDHAVELAQEVPAVAAYVVGLYPIGGTEPIAKQDVMRPEPGEDGLIRIDLETWLLEWPVVPGTPYEVRVAAVGPYGETWSDPSPPIVYTDQVSCAAPTITPRDPWHPPPSGAALAISISTASRCRWALDMPTWMTASQTTGSGNRVVTLTAAANPEPLWRSASVRVVGFRSVPYLVYQNPLATAGSVQAPVSVQVRP